MLGLAELSTGFIIILIIRLSSPLLIFKDPFLGSIITVLLDAFDVVIITLIGQGDFPSGHYAKIDKILDLYFLTIMLYSSLKFEKIEKLTCVILYVWRLMGVILFEFTGLRYLLFIFPNLFLWFYLFNQFRLKFFRSFKLTIKRILIILAILLVPKLIQEYMLHILELHPWEMIKEFINKL